MCVDVCRCATESPALQGNEVKAMQSLCRHVELDYYLAAIKHNKSPLDKTHKKNDFICSKYDMRHPFPLHIVIYEEIFQKVLPFSPSLDT